MKFYKYFPAAWFLIFIIAISGCDWFTNNRTRPAPMRPRVPAPTQKVRPAPTKRTPGAAALTEKQLIDRIDRIEAAAEKGDWAVCNREANLLGTDMARYRPSTTNGKSLRNIAAFDTTYAKLQADVKTKNRPAVVRDTKKLRNDLKRINHTAKTTG